MPQIGRFQEVLLDNSNSLLKNQEVVPVLYGTKLAAQLYNADGSNFSGPLITSPAGNITFYAQLVANGELIGYSFMVNGEVLSGEAPIYLDELPTDTVNYEDIGVIVASLVNGKIPVAQLPSGAISGVQPIVYGVGVPDPTFGANGQLYYDTQNIAFYGPKTDAGWGSVAIIKGVKGDTGLQGNPGAPGNAGADGTMLLYGEGAPPAIVGKSGDFYIQYTSGVPTFIWGPKSAGTGWGSTGNSLKGQPGVDGVSGTNGQSAYALWIAQGNTGDQAAFIASLKGAKGDTGNQGIPGTSDVIYDGVYNASTTYPPKHQVSFNGLLYIANVSTTGNAPVPGGNATWAAATTAGPAGSAGAAGTNGTNGTNGNTVLVGTVAPPNTLGVNGDSYFDKAAKTFYGPKASGVWPAAVPFKGDTGAAGTNGTSGTSFITGNGAPAQSQGTNGDSYLDLAAGVIYGPKASGAWPSSGVSVKGAKGDAGEKGASGAVSLELLLQLPFAILNSTYDSSSNLTQSTVKWPDASPGIYTPTATLNGDNDTIEAFTVTHAASGAVVTQAAPTRNSDGDIVSRPARQISYPSGFAPDYDPSKPTAVEAGSIYAESLAGYVADGVADMADWLQGILDGLPFGKALIFGTRQGTSVGPRVALSKTVYIRNGTVIKCPPRPKWLYKGQPGFAFVPLPNMTFNGSAMFKYSEPNTGANNMAYLENVVAYGQKTDSSGTIQNIHGLEIEGETFGLITNHCGFRRFGGWGVKYTPTVNQNGSGKQSRGHEHFYLSTESCATGGLDTNGLTDSTIESHHAHYCGIDSADNTACGAYIRGAGDLKYANGRHTFCERGIITGNSSITMGRPNSSAIKITGFNSDRSRYGGLHHRATGTRTWEFTSCVFGRDGRLESHSGADAETVSATASYGVIIGDVITTNPAPIIFEACQTQIGVDDASTDRVAQSSPGSGMYVLRNGVLTWNGGELAGKLAYSVFGPNSNADNIGIAKTTVFTTGSVDSPVRDLQSQEGGSGGYLLYTNGAYPPRPSGLANGDARYKGPVKPSDIQTLDDWIETDA